MSTSTFRGEHGSDRAGYHGYPKPDPQCSGLLTMNPQSAFFQFNPPGCGSAGRGGARGGAGIPDHRSDLIDQIRSIDRSDRSDL
jgi:hypothetical protein